MTTNLLRRIREEVNSFTLSYCGAEEYGSGSAVSVRGAGETLTSGSRCGTKRPLLLQIAVAFSYSGKHNGMHFDSSAKNPMHPNKIDLYAGLYGLALVPESFDLGHGAVMSRTYAHFMSPFLMAFAPASPGRPHPAPWKAAKGGIYIDITAELFLPAATSVPQLDRVNTIWWIVALTRLRTTNAVSVPVISSERYTSIPAIEQEPSLWPIEIHTPRLFPEGSQAHSIEVADLEWLRNHWYDAAVLLSNEDFNLAFEAVDSSSWNHSSALALVAIWGALERLFSPSNLELRFRVSANIAAYLEPLGKGRYSYFNKIKGLYDSRSKAAHGPGAEDLEAYAETYAIAKRVLLKMIEARHVPDKKELEANLFGDPLGICPGTTSRQ